MSPRGGHSSGGGRGGRSGAPPNESSQSRLSSSSTPGHVPQTSPSFLPPPPSISHCEVPTDAPSSPTHASGSSTVPNKRLQIEVHRDSILPSHQTSSYASSSCRSSATSSIEPEITRRINEAVRAEVRAEIRAELRAELLAEMRAEMQQMMNNMMHGRVNSPGVSAAPAEREDHPPPPQHQNDAHLDYD